MSRHDYRVVPLADDPASWGSDRGSRPSPFGVTRAAALNHLATEIRRLGGRSFDLELDVDPGQVRQDGKLRSGARPATGAVAVSFPTSDGRALRFRCWRYPTDAANLRAIGLTLEALRAVDRWGAAGGGAQYSGFAALPATTDAEDPYDAATQLLAQWSRIDVAAVQTEGLDRVIRLARRNAHPDAPDGSTDAFLAVQAAVTVVEQGPGR